MRPFKFIDTEAGFKELVKLLEGSPVIGVDTESDSLYSYFDKVCLFQFTADDQDLILDPLAFDSPEVLAPLGPIFANPKQTKIFHAAEYDILCLKRDFDFEFAGLFDTMIAAQLLGYERIGLADLLRGHFEVELDKRFQRAQWSKRPLDAPMLEYARLDTYYLADLMAILNRELAAKGRTDWAVEECEFLTARRWPNRNFDPDDFRRIKGAARLAPKAQAILKELYVARDERARELDRPAFKVVANHTLLSIAKDEPRDETQLGSIQGVSNLVVRRCGDLLLSAVERGRVADPPKAPPRHPRRNHDPQAKIRAKRLKEWRKTAAEPYAIQPHILLPNVVLGQLTERRPIDIDTLAQTEGMRRWMLQEVGALLVQVANADLATY